MTQKSIPDAHIDLSGAYLDAYNAIVEPDRVIRVSRYVLEHWSGLLDPIGFWLLAELRQRCRANGKKEKTPQSRNWWRGKQSYLAKSIHVPRTTVTDKLNDDGHPIRHFILNRQQGRRYSYKAGRSVPRSTRYLIAMDDPLTPAHQAALRSLLAVDKDKLPDRLQELAALESGDLLELLQQQSFDDDRWLPTVGDVVRDIHGPHIAQQTADLCSKLNARITRPDLVLLVPWYFRDKWLPHLKHRLALMILALRARCYYNAETGADRNEIEVSWAQFCHQLGIGKRQMRRLHDHPDAPQFYKVLEEAMGRRPAKILVGMRREPLVPKDEELYRQLLIQQEKHNVDPETGQTSLLESEKPGHFPTYGKDEEEKETRTFPDIREEKGGHFPTFGTGKPGHFPTQTSIALSEDIAPAGGNSSIAPTQENPAEPDTDETPDPENQETKTAAAVDVAAVEKSAQEPQRKDSIPAPSPWVFNAESQQDVIVIFKKSRIDYNKILKIYTNYTKNTYKNDDLKVEMDDFIEEFKYITVTGFKDVKQAKDFRDGLGTKSFLIRDIKNREYYIWVITPENMATLKQNQDMKGYDAFFKKEYK